MAILNTNIINYNNWILIVIINLNLQKVLYYKQFKKNCFKKIIT